MRQPPSMAPPTYSLAEYRHDPHGAWCMVHGAGRMDYNNFTITSEEGRGEEEASLSRLLSG